MARRTGKPSASSAFTGDERIVVLHGQEQFLQRQRLEQLREALRRAHGEEVETLRYDGRSAALADVLDELRSFSLMQRRKLVIVDEADELIKKHREPLERYAAEPVDIATLVLRPGAWNAQWRLHKAAVKAGAVVKCESMKPAEAERWLVDHARRRHRVKLDGRAAALMVEHIGADLGRLDSELAKLAVNVPEGEGISAEQVEALVGRGSDEAAWAIQEALLSGDAARAVATLHDLVHLAARPEQVVTYFVADLVRKLHHAAVMLARQQNGYGVCKALKIWGDRQRPFLAAARRLGGRRAARLLALLVDLDRRSKSGYGSASANLERFCVQFAAELR